MIRTKMITYILVILLILMMFNQNGNKTHANTGTWLWSSIEVLSPNSFEETYEPDIAVDSKGNIHVVFMEFDSFRFGIWYVFYNNSQGIWYEPYPISTESTQDTWSPRIAIDSEDNIYVTWYDSTDISGSGNDNDILYKKFNQSISSWSTTEVISVDSTLDSIDPAIIIDNQDNICIAWTDFTDFGGSGTDTDIFFRIFDQSTFSWSSTRVISNVSDQASAQVALAIDAFQNIHFAWTDATDYASAGGDSDIFHTVYDIVTDTWVDPDVVSTESDLSSVNPSIALDFSDNIYISWIDSTDLGGAGIDEDIFFKYYDQFFSNWTSTQVITIESSGRSTFPSILIDSIDEIHLVWRDEMDYKGSGTDGDIFYKKYLRNFGNWSNPMDLSSNIDNSNQVRAVIDSSGRIQVIWSDITDYNFAGTDWDLFYRSYTGTPNSPQLELLNIGIGYDSVGLSWDPVPFAHSYNIYRSTSTIEEASIIASITDTAFIDIEVENDTYTYYISAQSFGGESSRSNIVHIDVGHNTDTETVTQIVTDTTTEDTTEVITETTTSVETTTTTNFVTFNSNYTETLNGEDGFIVASSLSIGVGLVVAVLLMKFNRSHYNKRNC